MPELPEVETVRRGLEKALTGATIARVMLRRKDLRVPFPPGLAQALEGRRIAGIRRRAKYLLFELDSEDVLIAHLGMTGRFLIEAKAPKIFKTHDHLLLALADKRVVIYNDARRFGLIALAKKDNIDAHALFAHLGPEPLSRKFSPAYLHAILAARKAPIKTTLMDQSVVVGVGNIYASEALFLAGIDPRKPALQAAPSAPALVASIRKVLRAAIASGGSSLRDFLHVSGDGGHFQHRFRVYGRKGQPCFRCHAPIKSMRQGGRSTFWCPHCQK